MDTGAPVKVKRPRGRPPKIKRGSKGIAKPTGADLVQNSQDNSAIDTSGMQSSCVAMEPDQPLETQSSPQPTVHINPQVESPKSQITTSDKGQIGVESTEGHAPRSDGVSDYRSESRNVILPIRRSARQATVHATQVSEGTLRPPGPPHLEAALSIALRNLESETWGYLWSYIEKRQGERLLTPAEIKAASRSVRKAADAVDKADRDLEDAIDEMMSANNKKKRRGPALSKYVDKPLEMDSSTAPTPASIAQEVKPTSSKGKERERYLPPGSLLGAMDVSRGSSPISLSQGTSSRKRQN
ncbi:hypothetical protein BU17DRAFT_64812 [Hysterangium stoloniferum]|nr:hypothetical protein BU17DRAFT_64812 [Hysterangium stoloniferum]